MTRALVILLAFAAAIPPFAVAAGPHAVIDPDASVFGVPFGSSEAEFRKRRGDPDGYIQLSPSRRALIYGPSVIVVFRADRLVEVHVTRDPMDLMTQMAEEPGLSWLDIELSPGVRIDMSYADVATKLSRDPAKAAYGITYESKNSDISLAFTKYSSSEVRDVYKLRQIRVKSFAVR